MKEKRIVTFSLSLLVLVFFFGKSIPVSAASTDNTNEQNKTNVTEEKNNRVPKTDSKNNSDSTQNNEQQGWVTENGQTYYYKLGKKLTGLKIIDNSYYLFNKDGVRLSGVRKTPYQSTYSYYGEDGKRIESTIATPKAYYWIKQGKITGIKNMVKVISQRPQLPTGCEMTAVTMMLNFAGVKISKTQVANMTPRSSNPNKGFIGSPYKKYPQGYWVAPNGIKNVVTKCLGTSKVMTGASLKSIKNKLLHSHPVVVWVAGIDGFSNHALTLTGYQNDYLYYNDPWTGKKSSISTNSFMEHWRANEYRALSY